MAQCANPTRNLKTRCSFVRIVRRFLQTVKFAGSEPIGICVLDDREGPVCMLTRAQKPSRECCLPVPYAAPTSTAAKCQLDFSCAQAGAGLT